MGLFGKKKKVQPAPAAKISASRNETTYFGKNLKIKGRVSGDGDLVLLGALEGEFDLQGTVKIAQSARVVGNISAGTVTVNGSVDGIITAREKVHLEATARIKGHITAGKISILEGAVFDGEIQMNQGAGSSGPPSVSIEKPAAAEEKIFDLK